MPFVYGNGTNQDHSGATLAEQQSGKDGLKHMSYAEAAAALSYTVQKGDTLGKIAGKTLGASSKWRTIYDANRDSIKNPNIIHPGQKLSIPKAGGGKAPQKPEAEPDGTYTVLKGDTLGKIAGKTLGSAGRWREIYNANRNRISDPNMIRVGWTLTIPGQKVADPPAPAPEPPQPGGGGGLEQDAEGVRAVAMQITEVLETGGLGRYAALNDYDAGIISYGKHQATLASGHLETLLNLYLGNSNSATANALGNYMARVKSRDASLRSDAGFKQLLKKAAAEPEMQAAQDKAIIASHYTPAANAANEWNVSSPLGVSMLYDTNIQGGMATVLARTQSALGGIVGEKGITELAFLKKFNALRRSRLLDLAAKYGLQTSHGKALKASVYRCDAFDGILATGNLGLVGDIKVRGVTIEGFDGEQTSAPKQPGGGDPEAGSKALTNGQVSKALQWYGVRASQYPKDVVKQIQGKVNASKDGIIGPQTINAVGVYQKANGLTVDGKAGPATLTHMFGEDIRPEGGPAPGSAAFERPHGLSQLYAVFGNPGTNQQVFAMRGGAGGKLIYPSCHKLVGPLFQAVFQDIYDAGLSHHIQSYDGIYNYRKKRKNSTSWSTHAWGIAIDINATSNPMRKKADMTISQSQQVLAPFFEQHGFYWGANFGDPMHFQYATGY